MVLVKGKCRSTWACVFFSFVPRQRSLLLFNGLCTTWHTSDSPKWEYVLQCSIQLETKPTRHPPPPAPPPPTSSTSGTSIYNELFMPSVWDLYKYQRMALDHPREPGIRCIPSGNTLIYFSRSIYHTTPAFIIWYTYKQKRSIGFGDKCIQPCPLVKNHLTSYEWAIYDVQLISTNVLNEKYTT